MEVFFKNLRGEIENFFLLFFSLQLVQIAPQSPWRIGFGFISRGWQANIFTYGDYSSEMLWKLFSLLSAASAPLAFIGGDEEGEKVVVFISFF